MRTSSRPSRRAFVQAGSAACLLGSTALTPLTAKTSRHNPGRSQEVEPVILKSLKIGMVNVDGNLTDKFRAIQKAGFQGVELNCPGFDVAEAKAAMAATGLPVDGTVCSTHWKTTHTNADASVRAQALEDLKTAIRDTHAVGGNTVLLVAGVGGDGEEAEIWTRAVNNISQALPLAAQFGITIAIENVWNRFMYDHGGGADQTADTYAAFIDEFNSPWVGMQFDIGNHWKYGDCGSWIRTLNKRIVKLDIKGYSRSKNNWAKLGDDDINWPDVQAALKEINFHGWAAAEVGGGGPARLQEISHAMDACLGLKPV